MIGITAEEIRQVTSGELVGSGERVVSTAAPLEKASPDALSFVASARYLAYLQATRAGVVLVKPEWVSLVPSESTAVVVADPHAALEAILPRMYPTRAPPATIHPTAVIAKSSRVAENVTIGPFAVVEEECEIGAGSRIGAHSVIGVGCRIGADVTIHPSVTLYEGVTVGDRVVVHSGARVGKDGFGFVWREGHRKIPQVGGCAIEEDVEIGANVTIDRGSVGDTVIGAGTKIDNLVHIGHNVRIGKHVLIIAQVGISGSTVVGDGVVLAGQAGIGGHLEIGSKARVGGQAGVTADVPAGESYSGYPARPHREALRAQAAFFRLPELLRRLKRVEEALFGRDPK